jgi:hypothetical protein
VESRDDVAVVHADHVGRAGRQAAQKLVHGDLAKARACSP